MNKAILTSTGLSFLALGMTPLQTSRTAPVRDFNQNDAHVVALGACDITSQDAQCWNMDGEGDSTLTNRLKSALATNNQDLSFRFGKKNVFLVIENTGNRVNVSRRPQGYVYNMFLNQNGGLGLELVRVDPDEETGPVLLTGAIDGLPGPAPVVLNAALNSTAKVGDVTFTMGTYRVRNNPPVNTPFNNPWNLNETHADKEWVIAIGTSDSNYPSGNGYSPTQFSALDKDGKIITYVDKKGEPVSSLRYIEATNVNPQPGYRPPNLGEPNSKYLNAYVRQSQASVPGAFTLESDIDPKYIDSYRISTTTSMTFDIGPFPIRPK